MKKFVCSGIVGIVWLAGCGGSATQAGAGGGQTTATSGSGATTASGATSGSGATTGAGGSAPEESYSVQFGPVHVEPGAENTQCVVKRLGNPADLHVGRIHNALTDGSHHLIVYRTNDTEEITEPFDCAPFVDTLKPEKGSPLMITQKHDETLTLPDGVAFTLAPDQMVRLEMHFINVTSAPLEVSATSTFIGIDDSKFKDEADFLFIGNPDISLAPHQSATVGPTFFQVPSTFEGVNFFAITGHTHQWGTNVTVATTPGKNGPDAPVYDVEDWSWNEPATAYQDPPFQIPSDGGFRFTCEYNNTSDSSVGFGESAKDEMCFFWAYYYPSKGAYVCAHTDQVPGGFDICCPGSPFCDQLL